jgi:hypothetical protein
LLLGRSLKFTYSFTGEDRILESLCKSRITESGFYVDVGCNHPIFLSNTYLFYKRGWRGICIDANEKLIRKYKFYRPRDKGFCALVSNTKEKREFYKLTNDVLSTTEQHLLEPYTKQGQSIETTLMEPVSLTEILDDLNAPRTIDILSIDTEEHDFNVLQSLDLEKYSPRIIVIEVENFITVNPQANEVYNYLVSKKYFLEGFILTNLYFSKTN